MCTEILISYYRTKCKWCIAYILVFTQKPCTYGWGVSSTCGWIELIVWTFWPHKAGAVFMPSSLRALQVSSPWGVWTRDSHRRKWTPRPTSSPVWEFWYPPILACCHLKLMFMFLLMANRACGEIWNWIPRIRRAGFLGITSACPEPRLLGIIISLFDQAVPKSFTI